MYICLCSVCRVLSSFCLCYYLALLYSSCILCIPIQGAITSINHQLQNAGGAYTRDAPISLAITPPLPVPIKHDLIVGGDGGQARGIAKLEAERCS